MLGAFFSESNCPWAIRAASAAGMLRRAIASMDVNGATSTSVDITFAAPDGGMRYRISTEKPNNPFTQPLFKGFALPQKLLRSASDVSNS